MGNVSSALEIPLTYDGSGSTSTNCGPHLTCGVAESHNANPECYSSGGNCWFQDMEDQGVGTVKIFIINQTDLITCTCCVLVTCTKYSGLIVGKEEISLRLFDSL